MDKNQTLIISLRKRFMEIGIITLIVSMKLMLSSLIPGLKTPGELMWTGFILLIYTMKIFYTYKKIGQSTVLAEKESS